MFILSFHTGFFTRRMVLSFHKMTFGQVSHFVDLLQLYLECPGRSDNVNKIEELEESNLDVSMQSASKDDNDDKVISNQ